jgi:two-component system sensor histidine kinase KdpD
MHVDPLGRWGEKLSNMIRSHRPLSLATLPRAPVHMLAVATFALAAALAAAAQYGERPITAAIVFIFGVTLVGALEGVWGGVAAAVLASLLYNFFLSDPVFSFGLRSADEYVPLIAFNASAAASGFLVGRLKDRAQAAELGSRRMQALLDVSQRLQSAVKAQEIPSAAASFAPAQEGERYPELYFVADGELRPAQAEAADADLAARALREGQRLGEDGRLALPLSAPSGAIGVLVLPWGGFSPPAKEGIEAFETLVSITLERCLLLERVAAADILKRSEEFKTALLSSVSHDLRTPLNAISASASSLARYRSALSEEAQADLLAMIEEQCSQLDRYTANLLNLGRIQAGIIPDQFAGCDALEVLGAAIAHVRALGTGHRIDKHYETGTGMVRADPVMLEQIFYNVLENAVRYSPRGSRITISAAGEAGRLIILICDEGEGIAAEDRERVFERFTRFRSAAGSDGTGLGLSIAKGFTEAFGGGISALPNEAAGRGTCMRISLLRGGEE